MHRPKNFQRLLTRTLASLKLVKKKFGIILMPNLFNYVGQTLRFVNVLANSKITIQLKKVESKMMKKRLSKEVV